MLSWGLNNKRALAIFTIWLFSISACIGFFLGFKEWFLKKTVVNLVLQLALLIIIFPLRHKKEILLFITVFFMGFFAEVLGVKTGFPFGDYVYGDNLGLKLFNVPILIGFNWVVLAFTTGAISNYLSPKYFILKVLLGALLMLSLDILMEPIVSQLDFWEFRNNNAPIENYIAWFLLAFAMQYLFQRMKIKGDRGFSLNLFGVQFFFFLALNLLLA